MRRRPVANSQGFGLKAEGIHLQAHYCPAGRLFPLLPASQESSAQSQQDFIDERNDVRYEEVQSEQHGGDGE
jgi:hypothetical protein